MGPVDTIWQHSYRSTFAQVTECYFTAPSRHLNKCWLFMRKVIWQSSDGNFTASAQTTILYNDFEKYTYNYCQCIYIHTGSLQNQHFDYGIDKQWHSQEDWIVLTQRCPDSRGGLTEPSLWLCNGHHGKLKVITYQWAYCQIRKIAGCACAGNSRNVFPATSGLQSRHASRHVRDARTVMHAGIAD